MAISKERIHRMNSSGSYDTIHHETDSDVVIVNTNTSGVSNDSLTKAIADIKTTNVTQGNDISTLKTAYGATPIAVSSTSAMTDHNKIYVLTTNGNWYYYNGTSFVSGGTYQSTSLVTDKDLTTENRAADGKATGNMIIVNDTQPSSSIVSNKLWIKDNPEDEYSVPTYEEFSDLETDVMFLSSDKASHATKRYPIYAHNVSTGYYYLDPINKSVWTKTMSFAIGENNLKNGIYITASITYNDKGIQMLIYNKENELVKKVGVFNYAIGEVTNKVESYVPEGYSVRFNIGVWQDGASSYITDESLLSNVYVYITEDVYTFDEKEDTYNLINEDNYYENDNIILYASYHNSFKTEELDPGTYTLTVYGHSDNIIAFKAFSKPHYSSSSILYENNTDLDKDYGGTITFTVNEKIKAMSLASSSTATGSVNYNIYIDRVCLTKGDKKYIPINSVTCIDSKARASLPLKSSEDNKNITFEIQNRLDTLGYCELDSGVYYVDNIKMPDSSYISGKGQSTKLIFNKNLTGPCITLGSRSTVKDLTLYGDDIENVDVDVTFEDVINGLGSYKNEFLGTVNENTSSENILDVNDREFTLSNSGWTHYVLTTPILPGAYKISSNIEYTSQTIGYVPSIYFSTSSTTAISGQSIIAEAKFSNVGRSTRTFYVNKQINSIRIVSNNSATQSEGIPAIFSNINITRVGGRIGVLCDNPNNYAMIIENVSCYGFNCAGIMSQDTGTPVDRGLLISNCKLINNQVGIFLRKDAEFCQIVNCLMHSNYIGFYGRGGNLLMSNCNISRNCTGMIHDQDEGGNNGHGHVDGCTFAHNNGEHFDQNYGGSGIVVKDTGRMAFNGCYVGYNNIDITGGNGNIFTGTQILRNTNINITNGGCHIFNGNMFMTINGDGIQINITNNDKTKWIGNYTRNGTLVEP